MPKMSGTLSRLCSTATFCISRICSTPLRLKSPPTAPLRIFSATPLLLACPVTMSPLTGRLSCPNFSCKVMRLMRLSMKLFILVGPDCRATAGDSARPIARAAHSFLQFVILKEFFD